MSFRFGAVASAAKAGMPTENLIVHLDETSWGTTWANKGSAGGTLSATGGSAAVTSDALNGYDVCRAPVAVGTVNGGYMSIADISSALSSDNDPVTVYMVMRDPDASTTNARIIFRIRQRTSVWRQSSKLFTSTIAGGGTFQSSQASVADSTWRVFATRIQPTGVGGSYIKPNGLAGTSGNVAGVTVTETYLHFYYFQFAEILVYKAAHADADIDTNVAFLATKYAL